MSLPAGVVNRPPVAAANPDVLRGLLRLVLAVMGLLAPWLFHAATQVPGVAWQYECTALESDIEQARLERRRLAAERATLLDPWRLRREAERLGLQAPRQGPYVCPPHATRERH